MKAEGVAGLTVIALIGLAMSALTIGPGNLDFATVVGLLRDNDPAPDPIARAIIWDLRLPRILLAMTVGAALGAAGTVTQGMFRNPMAEPGVLGISMGAAMLAVVGFALEIDDIGLWVTPTLAGLGAGLVLVILFTLSRNASGFGTLLLSGIALGALFSAVITVVLAMGTERWDLGLKVVRWLMGSFEGRSWPHLWIGVVVTTFGLAICVYLRVDLDALALGHDTATSLGSHVPRTRVLGMAAVAILVGAATALCGVIGFVGLVVPHISRLWVGAGHRVLIPVATLGGAFVMLAVDTISRAIPSLPLPPGAITSLLGAPFFLWLLRRHTIALERC